MPILRGWNPDRPESSDYNHPVRSLRTLGIKMKMEKKYLTETWRFQEEPNGRCRSEKVNICNKEVSRGAQWPKEDDQGAAEITHWWLKRKLEKIWTNFRAIWSNMEKPSSGSWESTERGESECYSSWSIKESTVTTKVREAVKLNHAREQGPEERRASITHGFTLTSLPTTKGRWIVFRQMNTLWDFVLHKETFSGLGVCGL